jgi:hypothetical protein
MSHYPPPDSALTPQALATYETTRFYRQRPGLTTVWALFVGVVTASDENYLSGAQAWFPKGKAVREHEQALGLAHLGFPDFIRLPPASRVVHRRRHIHTRLGFKPGNLILGGGLVAAAEKRDIGEALEKAKGKRDEAGGRIVSEEAAVKQATAEDFSRWEAWGALFAIFTIINFAGPYAISRVLGKWPSDHASAKADAESSHHARASAKLLRSSRGAQKARAMRLQRRSRS